MHFFALEHLQNPHEGPYKAITQTLKMPSEIFRCLRVSRHTLPRQGTPKSKLICLVFCDFQKKSELCLRWPHNMFSGVYKNQDTSGS